MAHGRLRSGRAAADAGLRHERSRSRDEHLDVGSVPVPRDADRSRQGADGRDARANSASGAATRTSTATGSRTGLVPGDGTPAYFTRGSGHNAQGPVQRAADDYVQEHRPTRAEVRHRAEPRAAAGHRRATKARASASSPTARSHWAIVESRDQLREEAGVATSYLRGCAPFRSPTASATSSTATTGSTSSSRTATPRCCRCCGWTCAASVTGKLRSVLPLQRPADRRAQRHRQRSGAGRRDGEQRERHSR